MELKEIESLLFYISRLRQKKFVKDNLTVFTKQEIQQVVNILPLITNDKETCHKVTDRQYIVFISELLKYFFFPVSVGVLCLVFVFSFIQNNLYRQSIETTFVLYKPEAKFVQIAGDFTCWEPVMLTKKDGFWELKVYLKPGEYKYIYLINGEPYLDPKHDVYIDQFGNKNSVIYI